MLWVSLVVGAAVVATIALAALEQQRQLFFASTASEPHGGPKTGDAYDRRIRLRHELWRIRETLGRIAAAPTAVSALSDPRHPPQEHAARIILRALSETPGAPSPRNGLPAAAPETGDLPTDSVGGVEPVGSSPVSTAAVAAEGIARVDRDGQLKFADPIARELLHWSSGELTLSAILGGEREAAVMMEAVARREVVEQTVTVRTGACAEQLHATALASRRSDGNLYGALLILRRL